MWKKPSRPAPSISQSFNSGFVTVYTVHDSAQPGRMPQPQRTALVRLDYDERTVGVARYYAARQAMTRIDRVLRVQDPGPSIRISPQDEAETEDGGVYRIEQVQTVSGVWPRSLDLSLREILQAFPSGEGGPQSGSDEVPPAGESEVQP